MTFLLFPRSNYIPISLVEPYQYISQSGDHVVYATETSSLVVHIFAFVTLKTGPDANAKWSCQLFNRSAQIKYVSN